MNTTTDTAPPRCGAKPDLADRGRQRSTPGRMSAWTTIVIIAILVGFAVLHIIGATLIMNASDLPMAGPPAHMVPTD